MEFEKLLTGIGKEETRLLLARYIYEPRDGDSIIIYEEGRELSIEEVRQKLKEEIAEYTLYSEEEEKKMIERVRDTFIKSKSTLADAFDLEDLDSNGSLPYDQLS